VWGPGRVGYKIAPYFAGLGMSDSNPIATFSYLARELSRRRLLYLHVAEPVAGPAVPAGVPRITPILRTQFAGTVIANGAYDLESSNAVIAAGEADLVAFGTKFLANPDLPERFRRQAPLNSPQVETFYTGEARGYVDYPVLDAVAV
jgi:N-ethylmaleimide reductase